MNLQNKNFRKGGADPGYARNKTRLCNGLESFRGDIRKVLETGCCTGSPLQTLSLIPDRIESC